MPLRSHLVSRWFSQPAELLQRLPASKPRIQPSMTLASLRRGFSAGATATKGRTSTTRPFTFTFPRQQQYRPFRRSNSSSTKSNGGSGSGSEQPLSFSQRMKKLSKEYGWSALGVYLLLSALDFPICFAAVRLLGVERIGRYEHMIVESTKEAVEAVWARKKVEGGEGGEDGHSDDVTSSAVEKKKNGEEASLWTQVVLAYALHKSLIFIRVPITAAITPKVVRILRQWGWDLSRGRPKGL